MVPKKVIRRICCLAICFVLLAAPLPIACAAKRGDPEVRIERHGVTYTVSARIWVTADPSTVWAVLTDYKHQKDFVPDMQESRIVSRPDEPTLVRQRGVWSLLGYHVPVEILAEVEEDRSMGSIRFYSVGGNVRVENGEWIITECGDIVGIAYRVECTPEFWIPPLIGSSLIGWDVGAKLKRLAQEIATRFTEHPRSSGVSADVLDPRQPSRISRAVGKLT